MDTAQSTYSCTAVLGTAVQKYENHTSAAVGLERQKKCGGRTLSTIHPRHQDEVRLDLQLRFLAAVPRIHISQALLQ